MTAKRIAAVLVAIALIAGAVLLRRGVLDDDEDADDPPGSTVTTTEPATAAGELICISELDTVCQALRAELPDLRVDVQDAGVTLDELAQLPDDAPRPLWLTIEPFPAMLDALRTANGLEPFGGSAEPVGATRLAVATPAARAADLTAGCAEQQLWQCIGANAGNEWSTLVTGAAGGRIRPSVGVADRQAVALASFAAAVAGYFGRPDIRSSDWRDDPAFTPWVARLLGQVDASALSAGTPLASMAVRPALDIAATTTAELAALGGDKFVANYPEPSMWVEAVVAVPEGTAVPDDVVSSSANALSAAGWDAEAAASQALPGPTTMLALRALWQESTS